MDELDAGQQTMEADATGLTGQADAASESDPGQQTAQPLPDYEIQRDGQVIKVPYDQAKDYVQKGYDYTQKTQELARERDSLKPYQELQSYLQANPDKAQQIYNLLAGQQAGQEVDPVQQKISHLEQTTNNLILQNAQEKTNSWLNQIKGDEKYEGLFKDQDMEDILLATAMQTQKRDFEGLKSTADKIHNKWLKAAVKAEKAGEQKVIQNLASPTRKGEAGQGTFTPPKDFDPSKASYKELRQHAMEML